VEKYIILQGYYDCYAISNLGNVKNLRTGYVLNPSIRKDGYKSVLLSKDGKKMSIRIHQLVGMYFLDQVAGKTIINHIDGDKANNEVYNLEYCTHEENMKHANRTGLMNHAYKNKDIIVLDARTKEILFKFQSVKQCANFLNLNESPIYSVLKKRRNKHHNFIFEYENRIKDHLVKDNFKEVDQERFATQ